MAAVPLKAHLAGGPTAGHLVVYYAPTSASQQTITPYVGLGIRPSVPVENLSIWTFQSIRQYTVVTDDTTRARRARAGESMDRADTNSRLPRVSIYGELWH